MNLTIQIALGIVLGVVFLAGLFGIGAIAWKKRAPLSKFIRAHKYALGVAIVVVVGIGPAISYWHQRQVTDTALMAATISARDHVVNYLGMPDGVHFRNVVAVNVGNKDSPFFLICGQVSATSAPNVWSDYTRFISSEVSLPMATAVESRMSENDFSEFWDRHCNDAGSIAIQDLWKGK